MLFIVVDADDFYKVVHWDESGEKVYARGGGRLGVIIKNQNKVRKKWGKWNIEDPNHQ